MRPQSRSLTSVHYVLIWVWGNGEFLMNTILTLSGLSRAEKTKIGEQLLRQRHTRMVTGTTTRPPRDSDLLDEYEHMNPETFERCRSHGEFLWDFSVGRDSYGTRKSVINEFCMSAAAIGIMILVPAKVLTLNSLVHNAYRHRTRVIPIYLDRPGDDVLHERLAKGEPIDGAVDKRSLDERAQAKKSTAPFFEFVEAGQEPSGMLLTIEKILALLHE